MHQKYHFVILTTQLAKRLVSSVGMMEYVDGEIVCMCQVSSACRWLTHETSEELNVFSQSGVNLVVVVIDTMSIIIIIMISMTVVNIS